MASNLEFVEYMCEQISEAGNITYKKMFGEYGIYCDDKFIGLICDNQFFVKKTEAGAKICPDLDEAPPYEGAKPHFVIDSVDNKELTGQFIRATYDELPVQKPRKKKK